MNQINFPTDFLTNLLIVIRWGHFVAGITWIGLLYFFNLVSVPFINELDPGTRAKILPVLMLRALKWFRGAAGLTVLFGFAYWSRIVGSDAHNAGAKPGAVFGWFFLIWTVTWVLMYICLIPGKGLLNKGPVLAVIYTVLVVCASWLFLTMNNRGWESNQLLSIGIGGGIGWVLMLNVWGIVWRCQKRIIQWTAENAKNGTPIPEKAKHLARQAFLASRASFYLTFPLLFFMGASSHYPMFGR